MKATFVVIDGKGKEIFKDPVTDSGLKKSAYGLLRVDLVNGAYVLTDRVSFEDEKGGELQTIYTEGVFSNTTTLTEIRNELKSN